MAYYTDLFSPETFEAFNSTDRTISGFRATQIKAADRLEPGDKLVCFVAGVSIHRSRRLIVYTVLAIASIAAAYWAWLPRGPY